MIKTLDDYLKATESDEPIDAETKQQVEDCLNSLKHGLKTLAEKMQKGTAAGDIWELVRPSTTQKEQEEALNRLHATTFNGVIGKRRSAMIKSKIKSKTTQKSNKAAILLASNMEPHLNRKENLCEQTPKDAERVFRLRYEDELGIDITGKSRKKIDSNTITDENETVMNCESDHIDIETQIYVREALKKFKKLELNDPYHAAIIEAEVRNLPLKKISEEKSLSYEKLRQIKSRKNKKNTK